MENDEQQEEALKEQNRADAAKRNGKPSKKAARGSGRASSASRRVAINKKAPAKKAAKKGRK